MLLVCLGHAHNTYKHTASEEQYASGSAHTLVTCSRCEGLNTDIMTGVCKRSSLNLLTAHFQPHF